jgi:cytochrome c oxidase subunit 2
MLEVVATSDSRREYADLFSLYVPVAAAVILVVGVALFVTLVRDRAGRNPEPSKFTRSPRLELTYVVVLAVVAGLLAWRTLDGTNDLAKLTARATPAPEAGPAGLTVRAVAAKWNWRFEYPGGVVSQGRGPGHLATLVVPYGGAVRFRLVTTDVEHAMWIPAARYKYDAVPGRANVFDMRFDRGVRYDAARCSEYCGQYHEQMQFKVDVRSPNAFRSWLARRQRAKR